MCWEETCWDLPMDWLMGLTQTTEAAFLGLCLLEAGHRCVR